MHTSIRLCNRCVLPNSYPGLSLDASGICHFCRNHKKEELLGEKLLQAQIAQQPSGNYDCLLGISGGKDSCYVAYLARKRLGLRALAVFYDFPFIRDLARDNARRVCDSLGIDLIFIKTGNNLEYKLLRNHLISLSGTGTTWGQCIFCHYGIDGALYKIARENNIHTILSGTTANEVWWNPGDRSEILLQRLKYLSPKELTRFAIYQLKAYWQLVDQRRQFRIPGNNALAPYSTSIMPADGPRMLRVFSYLPWNQKEIEKVLMERTGWVKPEKRLTWRYDCILEPLLDYTYLREFGVSTVGLYLSSMIRNGLIDREEAMLMRAEAEDPESLRQNMQTVFSYLNLPEAISASYFRNGMPQGVM